MSIQGIVMFSTRIAYIRMELLWMGLYGSWNRQYPEDILGEERGRVLRGCYPNQIGGPAGPSSEREAPKLGH